MTLKDSRIGRLVDDVVGITNIVAKLVHVLRTVTFIFESHFNNKERRQLPTLEFLL